MCRRHRSSSVDFATKFWRWFSSMRSAAKRRKRADVSRETSLMPPAAAATWSAGKAAGVMPGMREAWSIVSGRANRSRSIALGRQAGYRVEIKMIWNDDRRIPHDRRPLTLLPCDIRGVEGIRLTLVRALERRHLTRLEMQLDLTSAALRQRIAGKRVPTKTRRGVVRPQGEAMLGARGHHAIGFGDALQCQIVNHHANIRCPSVEPHGF